MNNGYVFQIRQQAKDFANLTTNSDKNTFLNTQKEAFLTMSPEDKLEHFEAIQQRIEELKQKIQKPVLV
jgi:anti-sigma28 factor (negative regulator of flagellin synthesis)